MTDSLAIYDTINFIRSNVSTICTGIAGAAAALLLSAGTKGKRMCLPNARILLHQVYGRAEGPAVDVQILAKEVGRLKSLINQLLARHTGKQLRKIEHDTDRDFYLTAGEAIKYGLVDQVLQTHILPSKEKD